MEDEADLALGRVPVAGDGLEALRGSLGVSHRRQRHAPPSVGLAVVQLLPGRLTFPPGHPRGLRQRLVRFPQERRDLHQEDAGDKPQGQGATGAVRVDTRFNDIRLENEDVVYVWVKVGRLQLKCRHQSEFPTLCHVDEMAKRNPGNANVENVLSI